MEWGCPRSPSCSRPAHDRNVLGERAQLWAPRPAPSFVVKVWVPGVADHLCSHNAHYQKIFIPEAARLGAPGWACEIEAQWRANHITP